MTQLPIVTSQVYLDQIKKSQSGMQTKQGHAFGKAYKS